MIDTLLNEKSLYESQIGKVTFFTFHLLPISHFLHHIWTHYFLVYHMSNCLIVYEVRYRQLRLDYGGLGLVR